MGDKLKSKLRILAHRLRFHQKKKTEISLKSRKEIAEFIEQNKLERARIRVEQTVRDDYTVEALDLVEGYCDLLLARFALYEAQKSMNEDLAECICTLMWVAPRLSTDIPELKEVCKYLKDKYGEQVYEQVLKEGLNVSEKIKVWLRPQPPPKSLIEKYMQEIAQSFDLTYNPETLPKEDKDYKPEIWQRDAERAVAKAQLSHSIDPGVLNLPDLPTASTSAGETNNTADEHQPSEMELFDRLARLKGNWP